MAHRLEPRDGCDFLTCTRVIERLRDEFDNVDADADQGSDDVGDMIAKLIELKAPQSIIDDAMAGREQSFRVTIADGPGDDSYISFMLQPNTGPLIGYHSRQHEDTARAIVDRCASALDYQIVVV